MTAPPAKRAQVVCRKKRRHPDEITARAAAQCAIQVFGNVTELYIYRCKECRGWHLTRFPNPGTAYRVTADEMVHEAA